MRHGEESSREGDGVGQEHGEVGLLGVRGEYQGQEVVPGRTGWSQHLFLTVEPPHKCVPTVMKSTYQLGLSVRVEQLGEDVRGTVDSMRAAVL